MPVLVLTFIAVFKFRPFERSIGIKSYLLWHQDFSTCFCSQGFIHIRKRCYSGQGKIRWLFLKIQWGIWTFLSNQYILIIDKTTLFCKVFIFIECIKSYCIYYCRGLIKVIFLRFPPQVFVKSFVKSSFLIILC